MKRGTKTQPAGAPILVFPLGGCEAAGAMTKDQVELRLRVLRETVRVHWNDEGLQAFLKLLEMRTATQQQRAIQAGSTEHDKGQACGLGLAVSLAREIQATVEDTEEESAQGRRRRGGRR